MRESKVYGQPSSFRYTIFIDGDIEGPELYRDEFDVLENAQEGDVIVININSGGGRLDTTIQFISLIETCRGHVVTKLCGQAASGAAMIFLCGHELQISSLAELMAHSASSGFGGKISDMAAYIKHSETHIRKIMDTVYEGFLSPEELDKLHNGAEFWMSADEIDLRLQERQKLFEKQRAESQQEIEELFDECELPEWIFNKLSKAQMVSLFKGESIITDWDDDTKKFTFMSLEEYENSLTAEQE